MAGVDALGFVFYAPSPRAVTSAQAAVLMRSVPAFVTRVGLFVDADAATIRSVLSEVPLELLQFHGDEEDAFCAQFGRPWIKAIRVREPTQLRQSLAAFPGASALLLDAWDPAAPGGTGLTFDWSWVPEHTSQPLILAGGLHADNVTQAIRQTRPYAVDVSGGVESARGIKAAEKIHAFMAGVQRA